MTIAFLHRISARRLLTIATPFLTFMTLLFCSWTAKALDVTVIPSLPRVAFPIIRRGDARFSKVTLQSASFASITPDKIQIFLNEQKVNVTWQGLPSTPKGDVYGSLDSNAKQLDLWLPWHSFAYRWPDYHGTVTIRVGVNGDLSEIYTVVVSAFESRWWPATIAAVATFVILGIPILIVSGARSGRVVGDRTYGTIAALFLEKETDTYSLSRLQFYMWTAAAIFGYIVLTVAQTLVQGQFVFANIPQGLPGIIFISAATTATAQGVTSIRGAKGAGPIYPSFSDFVTTGGVVAPERFQFLVWTILGVFTFLFLVIFHSPETLTDLPKIPDGFLAMMGISSFGYLGGRLARKPGPIVDTVTPSIGSLILTFQGRKLSRDCGIKVDGTEVKPTDMDPVTARDPDDKTQPPEFYKTVVATIRQPNANWQKGGRHSATIINPDGQEAQWIYALPSQPIIEDGSVKAGDGIITLTLKGKQLSPKASFAINGTDVPGSSIVAVTPGPEADEEFQPVGDTPAFFTSLTLVISNLQSVLEGSDHLDLVITNPDHKQYKFTSPQIAK
jgi:hypothetical protein